MSFCETSLFDHEVAYIGVPARPHVDPSDGGHLIVSPKRGVQSRLELNPTELLSLEFCVRIACRVLLELGYCNWVNIQENGNWAFGRGEKNQMHVHVYGRSKLAIQQPFGESLRFPLFKDLGDWKVDSFDARQHAQLKIKCEGLSQDSDSRSFLNSIDLLSSSKGDQ